MRIVPIGEGDSRDIQQLWRGRIGSSMCPPQSYFVLASHSLCPHSTSDLTGKGNGSSALYLIIYSLFRRISASIAKTIVLTILRFLDFAFAR